jgi:GTP cyclohydrolase IA
MTETGSRKFSASALSENEPVSVKRVKNDDSDYSTADSSSESQDEGERLQRMTSAIRTIIEVGAVQKLSVLNHFFKICFNFLIFVMKTFLSQCMGEDTDREGLERTPNRAAKALQFFTSGYCQTVSDVIGEGIFNEETSSDMVMVKNIDIHSLCEHHMVPFSGRVTIAYIPQGKILGLSKLARIANLFARRLQVQERLTRQIANAVMESISPLGVGVTIEATYVPVLSYPFLLPHYCIFRLSCSGNT